MLKFSWTRMISLHEILKIMSFVLCYEYLYEFHGNIWGWFGYFSYEDTVIWIADVDGGYRIALYFIQPSSRASMIRLLHFDVSDILIINWIIFILIDKVWNIAEYFVRDHFVSLMAHKLRLPVAFGCLEWFRCYFLRLRGDFFRFLKCYCLPKFSQLT